MICFSSKATITDAAAMVTRATVEMISIINLMFCCYEVIGSLRGAAHPHDAESGITIPPIRFKRVYMRIDQA